MPYLSRITIYPIKALDGQDVESVSVLPSGALQHNRTYALLDEQGMFVNGKRCPQVFLLRSVLDLATNMLTLDVQGTGQHAAFHIDKERDALEEWLSAFFGFPVTIAEDTSRGFPDSKKYSGPTIISTGTLAEVASWFEGLDEQVMRRRLRANLEIGGVCPFWEDRLFAWEGARVQFEVGNVLLEGVKPCARCAVPPRDPLTGEAYPYFQKIFMSKREETLPSWAERSRFDHCYKVSLITEIPTSEAGKMLRVGDEVTLHGIVIAEPMGTV